MRVKFISKAFSAVLSAAMLVSLEQGKECLKRPLHRRAAGSLTPIGFLSEGTADAYSFFSWPFSDNTMIIATGVFFVKAFRKFRIARERES